MDPALEKEIEHLRQSKVKELQNRYRELFNEDSPSSNRASVSPHRLAIASQGNGRFE